ncbi:uncharacterized protein LACBIDRAFT_296856 [Laccaria bicolor S238N-H82]|uniref:Predicted protein n=1 Tax=Laccaria bicolor (strain S238N-H82 / ATCC MYA-4686) TaxID=486041 RepID=B0D9F4_LACBS|nr:uncharacterized protein LACBIDRAFT_296856 [Laccaria bicolor S238N-H82]EDR08569.1 predicted protein [Laccaria bicolor S238N-H82]|eukprot:XP_001880794.1 predicted protein [Laccaria bicolor S238N-H82]
MGYAVPNSHARSKSSERQTKRQGSPPEWDSDRNGAGANCPRAGRWFLKGVAGFWKAQACCRMLVMPIRRLRVGSLPLLLRASRPLLRARHICTSFFHPHIMYGYNGQDDSNAKMNIPRRPTNIQSL